MESPDTWDALTASLAAAGLGDEARAWAFLRHQGLVRDDAEARFVELARYERDREITGPSSAARVASALFIEGLASDAASTPDPGAVRAGPAFAAWRATRDV
jgi:hypothetical protein